MSVKPMSAPVQGMRFYGFMGMRAFVSSFRHMPDAAVAVIFDVAERLIELSPIMILDNKPKPVEKLADTIFSFAFSATPTINPVIHQNDYIWSIISTMKSDAFLHSYNTFFYRIPKETRPLIREAVLSFLNSKMGKAQFDTRMQANFAKRPRGADPVQQIYDLVNSDQGQALKAAVLAVQKGGDPEAVADASTVSSYEIRYVLSFLNSKS